MVLAMAVALVIGFICLLAVCVWCWVVDHVWVCFSLQFPVSATSGAGCSVLDFGCRKSVRRRRHLSHRRVRWRAQRSLLFPLSPAVAVCAAVEGVPGAALALAAVWFPFTCS